MRWGVVEMHLGMLFQPALGGCVLVNVEVVDHHVQLPLGKATTTSFMNLRKFTDVRRCLTWITSWAPSADRAGYQGRSPWLVRTYTVRASRIPPW